MKEFPSYLPRPLRRNYDIQHTSPFARTEMITGRARQRRTFTSVPSIVSVEWHMGQTEAPLFEAWFKYEITDGTEWFLSPLRTPEAPTGPLKMYECRFTGMYSGPTFTDDDEWEFSAELETRERPVLTQAWWQYGQEFIAGQSIIDIALNKKWPAYAWDYLTYAAAVADLDNLYTGQIITVKEDETQGGAWSKYSAYVAPDTTLILDFANDSYFVFDKTSALILEAVYA